MAGSVAKKRKTNDGGSQIIDPRFANIHSDPRYRLPSKKQKVKLDSRFKKALKSDAFVKRAKVDRYGRKVISDTDRRRLGRKFDLDEDDDKDAESDEPDDDDEVQRELARVEQRHDPLREGKLDANSSESESESSSEEESDDEAIVEDDDDDNDVVAQGEKVPTGEVSNRIAIVNLDWDNIRAGDLMAVFSSFLPTGDRLLQVAVFPSDFGKERMEREELEGPPKEIFARKADKSVIDSESSDIDMAEEDEDDEDIKASIIKPDDGSEFDSQALRQYQLERLRYFFAVLTFSSEKAAKHIYDAVDGTEYLTTANFFDLRFIPNDMDFSGDKARDACNTLPSDYKPSDFVTDALQHSKVKLTWDQDDRSRKDAQARAFRGGQKEIDENDLKAYLGSDTSDDDDEDQYLDGLPVESATKSQKQIEREKARALLGFAAEPVKSSRKDKDTPLGNIQVTFASGLSGAADPEGTKRSVFENSPEPNETTAEKYIRKEKERKQRRKEKMKAQRSGVELDEDRAASDATASPEPMQDQDVTDGFDDPFFNDANLNDPAVKNKIRREERLKKRKEREAEEAASAKQRAELELLMAEDENEQAQAAGASGNKTVRHFDMAEIEKAEKRKGKKAKYRKPRNNESTSNAALQDDFKMNVSDPRLGRLFEDHEFAIDPTNQKLKQTTGMKELIEENRKRKRGKLTGTALEATQPSHVSQTTNKKPKKKQPGDSEVRDLVAKLKRKTT